MSCTLLQLVLCLRGHGEHPYQKISFRQEAVLVPIKKIEKQVDVLVLAARVPPQDVLEPDPVDAQLTSR